MTSIITSIRIDLGIISPEHDELIHTRLMRSQQSAMRIAYNRLQNGWKERVIWQLLRTQFPLLTGRNINDAIMTAKGILASQAERLPKELEKAQQALVRSQKAYAKNKSQTLRKRVKSLNWKTTQLVHHQASGTVPPAIFGGQRAWKDTIHRLPNARDKWRHRRCNQFISRGAKNNRGNAHCRLIINAENDLKLHVRVSTQTKWKGTKQTTVASWLEFPISYSKQFDPVLRNLAILGSAGTTSYTVRLIRVAPKIYRAFITYDEVVEHKEYSNFDTTPNWVMTACGIDLNLGHVAMCITGHTGQFGSWSTIKFHNLGELPRPKSKWLVGNIARDVIMWAKAHGAQVITLESLNIVRSTQSPRMNRRTIPFSYRQLAQAISRRALREGLIVKTVNPAYTSWIGRVKYTTMYGISTHVAAAYVIGRRTFGFVEKLPKSLIQKFPELEQIISQTLFSSETDSARLDEWRNRLHDWKSYTPSAGRPWVLWSTLLGLAKISSEARSIILG
jgi:IS605 OrfB family transposase